MTRKRFDSAPHINVKDEGMLIQQVAGSTTNLLEVKSHSGATLMAVDYAGTMTSGASNTFTYLAATTSASLPANTTIGAVSPTELGYLDGVTSAIQTQLDAKAPLASPTFTGTVTLPTGTVTSGMILDGTIVNGDINSAAAIALSKLASGTSGQVVVANASGIPTYVTLSGDVTVDATGATTIAANSVALGTDTTGNYVASLVAGTGITLTNNTGEGATPTVAITSSPTISGTVTAGGFSAVGTATLNRASATAWNAGANINLQIDGVTYSTIGVNSNSRVQFSGGVEIGSVSIVSAGNNSYMQFGPNATWGAYLRVGSSTQLSGSGIAAVISTDGNLHLDAASNGKAMYLNYYSGGSSISVHGPFNTNGYNIAAGGGAVTGGNFSASGYILAGSYISIGTAYNGPLSNGGAIIRLRSGNEGSFIWDGNFGFYVDVTRVKNFTIQHPLKPANYLVHACAEGPTSDVFYRGEGQLHNGRCVITLPDYFEELTELHGRSVMLTPIADENGMVANLAAYEIYNGEFLVEQIGGYVVPDQRFWWRVDAIRKNTTFPVEPLKTAVKVGGIGPYTFVEEVS